MFFFTEQINYIYNFHLFETTEIIIWSMLLKVNTIILTNNKRVLTNQILTKNHIIYKFSFKSFYNKNYLYNYRIINYSNKLDNFYLSNNNSFNNILFDLEYMHFTTLVRPLNFFIKKVVVIFIVYCTNWLL